MHVSTTHTDNPVSAPTARRFPRIRGDLSWPLLLGLAAFSWTIAARTPLSDPDTFWHIAQGRWIAQHGRVPTVDSFSFSMPGAPWSPPEWAAELFIAGASHVAGWAGLVLITAASFGFTIAYLTRFLLRRMEPLHALVFALFAGRMMMPFLFARPHALAWPLTVIWVGTLVEYNEAGRRPPWWLLGLLLLWVNLHSSFVLGLALAAGVGVDAVLSVESTERKRVLQQWGLFAIVASACVLINPRGLGAITFVFDNMRMRTVLALTDEWQVADFQKLQVLAVWLLALLGLAFTGRLRLPAARSTLVLGLIYLALQHVRNQALLGLIAPLLIARPMAMYWRSDRTEGPGAKHLDHWFRKLAHPAPMRIAVSIWLLAVTFAVAALGITRPQPAENIMPQRALDALIAAGGGSRILNSLNFGGYLIYRGVPVYIDGRTPIYGDAFFEETMNALWLTHDGSLEALLDKYRIDSTLLTPNTPASWYLDHQPQWRRVYGDSVAVVHVRQRAGAAP